MVVMKKYIEWENNRILDHAAQAFPTQVLSQIEAILPDRMSLTAETGCGKSTVLFSNLSSQHFVFSYDDLSLGNQSSVAFYRNCPVTNPNALREIFGPTQKTLPNFSKHGEYDCVLIDGPHGYPFPEIEYFYFYPHIRTGGFLILDDVNIPTIGRMADILCEDDMWSVVSLISCTLVLRRTDSPITNPEGDEWWTQKYNRRRVSRKRDIFYSEEPLNKITELNLDKKLYGD